MAISLREGIFGEYYGNDFNSSGALTNEQMEVNASYLYRALLTKGFTVNAIGGILGNMEVESSINPGRWQSDRVGGDATGHGYGLVQWTPYTKYTNWCTLNDYLDPSTMDSNIARIIYEIENGIQWIPAGDYSDMSFEDFRSSTLDSGTLAKAFILCYERPADQSVLQQNYRASLGNKWYKYLTGNDPVEPSNPSSTSKKKGFNFILFNRQRNL